MTGESVRTGDSLRRRQILTLLILFGGYAACYFCRADLAVATPMLIDEFHARGMPHAEAVLRIGYIASLGTLAYALGKVFLTSLADFRGGRLCFLIGLGGATTFSIVFALGGALPVFTLAWLGNRLTQSIAWAGLLKVSSKWWDFSVHGTVIGILSLSYLVGDALARQVMGAMIEYGAGWRSLFLLAAGVVGTFLLAALLLLRESRTELGFPPTQVNPRNIFGAEDAPPASIGALVRPLLASLAFLVVCALSLGTTLVRETFNNWTPVFLHDQLGFGVAQAASASAVFPGIGAISVLLAGWLSDRLGANSRATLLTLGLAIAGGSLLMLAANSSVAADSRLALVSIGLTAFCLLGPYAFLGGAIALDFGGKQGSALASGIIDGIGYLGSVLAGVTVAAMSNAWGWSGVFACLAAVSFVSALGALYLWRIDRRPRGVPSP